MYLRDRRRADERNRLHFRMRQQRIHAFASAVDDIEHALRQAGFFQQLRNLDRGQRHFFARLQHKRIAASHRDRIHPERHHGGKIERRDPDANAERLPDRVAINPARDILELSPINSDGTPQANSTISIPRLTSPRDSTSVLPCSRVLLRTIPRNFFSAAS